MAASAGTEAEGSTVNVRRGAAIAWGSALALLVFLAAFDNQWLDGWRQRQGRSGGLLDSQNVVAVTSGGSRSWTSEPVSDLSILNWRVSPGSGESGREFGGNITAVLLSFVLSALLIWVLCRGLGTTRGRFALFVGVWFSVAAAASLAMIAGVAVSSAGSSDAGGYSFSSGTLYYLLIGEGLGFGLFIGWLIGLVAVLIYNMTRGMNDLAFNSSYQPSAGYDYGMSGLAADYGIGQTRTAPASPSSYYPPTSSGPDAGESPTTPLGPYGRG